MAFPPNAFASDDGRVYSQWEAHKLACLGARRLAIASAVGSALLFALDRAFSHGDAVRELPMWATALGLLLSLAVAAGVAVAVTVKGVELQRPVSLATLVALSAAAGGGIAAAALGGLGGPLAFGLVPVLLAFPALVPLGTGRTALVVLGGVVVHALVCLGLAGAGASGPAFALLAFALLAAVGSVGAARVIEHWRQKAAEASQLDWLTGALARPALEERLSGLLQVRARALAPITLVMFDVDRFRVVNDLYGRATGDELLELLVGGIKSEIRAGDFLGRYGGDEFLLVLDNCDGNGAVLLLERLRERLSAQPVVVNEAQVVPSFSAGIVSVMPGDPLVLRDLLRRAERALTISKDSGRNRTMVAPPPPPVEGLPSLAEMPIPDTDGQETQIQ